VFAASALRIGSHTFPHFPRLIMVAIILRTFRARRAVFSYIFIAASSSRGRLLCLGQSGRSLGLWWSVDDTQPTVLERSIISDDRGCKMTSW